MYRNQTATRIQNCGVLLPLRKTQNPRKAARRSFGYYCQGHGKLQGEASDTTVKGAEGEDSCELAKCGSSVRIEPGNLSAGWPAKVAESVPISKPLLPAIFSHSRQKDICVGDFIKLCGRGLFTSCAGPARATQRVDPFLLTHRIELL